MYQQGSVAGNRNHASYFRQKALHREAGVYSTEPARGPGHGTPSVKVGRHGGTDGGNTLLSLESESGSPVTPTLTGLSTPVALLTEH